MICATFGEIETLTGSVILLFALQEYQMFYKNSWKSLMFQLLFWLMTDQCFLFPGNLKRWYVKVCRSIITLYVWIFHTLIAWKKPYIYLRKLENENITDEQSAVFEYLNNEIEDCLNFFSEEAVWSNKIESSTLETKLNTLVWVRGKIAKVFLKSWNRAIQNQIRTILYSEKELMKNL